ncbi:hypothetical protein AYY17_19965 [Morganella psychrotolerans]|uniref:Uncharacterized protein n=1 Tax=Morganella psychrotolerans TaxID=368603 RepID=A0A1B8HCR0_9GAMM|nr:hypothetical protein AYY17_19965 [Morganella psychrotolerans]
MQLLEFIRYLYLSQKNKLFIAIFIVALTAVQLVNEGVDATTFLGFILGLAFVMGEPAEFGKNRTLRFSGHP